MKVVGIIFSVLLALGLGVLICFQVYKLIKQIIDHKKNKKLKEQEPNSDNK